MPWLIGIITFIIGAGLGFGVTLLRFRRRFRLARIEICNLEYEVNHLKEFNKYCLNHAAGVLLTWEDYKESHGID